MAFGSAKVHWRKRISGLVFAGLVLLYIIFGTRSSSVWTQSRVPGLPEVDSRRFSPNAINNTVFIAPVNAGMLHWADNLLCSLSQTTFETRRIIFWTLDAVAQQILDSKGYVTYRDPTLFSSSEDENHRGGTPAYKRMMKERPKFFIDVLSSGYDIAMLDADTVFWQSPLMLIPDNRTAVDAVFSTDAREFYQTTDAFQDPRRRGSIVPPICNGIFWMKSSNETVALWSEMLDVFNKPWPIGAWQRRRFQDDQRGMDVLLNDGRARVVEPFPDGISRDMVPKGRHPAREMLNIRLLDQTLVVNGHLLQNRHWEYQRKLAEIREMGKERIAAHFNWDTRELTKEEGARELGLYFLDDHGRCKFNA